MSIPTVSADSVSIQWSFPWLCVLSSASVHFIIRKCTVHESMNTNTTSIDYSSIVPVFIYTATRSLSSCIVHAILQWIELSGV